MHDHHAHHHAHHHDGDCCHHEHHHEEGCCHHHEHHEEACHSAQPIPDDGLEKRIYLMEGLDCANCAAKIEAKLRTLPGIGSAVISFPTRQLRISAEDPEAMLPAIQAAVDSVEEGVTVVPWHRKKPEQQEGLLPLILGGVLFVIGLVLEKLGAQLWLILGVLLPAYGILGKDVLLTAWKNIRKGHAFDENFLMSLATLGAFGIGEYPEAVGVMLFYRIGEYFEERAVSQSRQQILSAVDLRPETVNLAVGPEIRVIAAENARVGDIVLVRPGDRIPLDGIVVEGESRIDTSPVTGESIPVRAEVGSHVLSGCVNTSGQLKMQVEKPLEESMVTRILNSVENAAANKPAMDKFITRFARVYTPAVVFSALFIALVLPFLLPNWHFFVNGKYAGMDTVLYSTQGTASVFTALTFLVISCPCALVLSVPLAFFSAIGSASKKGILFKGGNAIEALCSVKAVAMDKTGTITQGNFRVQQALPGDPSVSEEELLSLAAGCEGFSTHPIAASILSAAQERGITPETPSRVEELAGLGIRAELSQGSALCGSRKLMEENGIALPPQQEPAYGTQVLLACGGVYWGKLVLSDTLKADAVEAVRRIRSQGIVTAMLTGDAQDSAAYVAKQTGIDRVHARLLPEDKLSQLQDLRRELGSVMYVGDGINDAPVLAGADVGAAMGSGADAAIEAADVVFMTSEMSAIPDAVQIARNTSRISWENVVFALAVKAIVMVLGLLGYANMWVAVFADTGVSMLCLLNSIRLLYF